MAAPSKSVSLKAAGPGIGMMLAVLLVVLGGLLGQGMLPGRVQFSNDGPLGRIASDCHRLPERFSGCWHDLNSIGYREESAVPSLSYGLMLTLGPLWFSKLYTPLALAFLGLSAWCLFRQWRLPPAACVLGGLAATLNSAFFSTACWGMGAHALLIGTVCLALAAVADTASPRRWLRIALAGCAVGMGVVEGADVGAIFSMLVAGFVLYQAVVLAPPTLPGFSLGLARIGLIAACALLVAASSLQELFVTSLDNVVAAGVVETRTEGGHWDWATQWSLPKVEALGLVVPGLFGYRTDTPDGGNYWGATGRHPVWDRYFETGAKGPQPSALLRYVGGGNYTGIAVVLVALWAATQSFRRQEPVFDPARRKLVWFWLAVAVASLLFAFGRFAPFYHLVYLLPYFRTIRNPVKFIHVFSLAMVVLFTLGVEGLWNVYLQPLVNGGAARKAGARGWWAQASPADKVWLQGCLCVFGLSIVGWVTYALCRERLEDYLQVVLFAPALATRIAEFSVGQVGWFVLFFALSAGLLALILSRFFAGPRALAAMALLGIVIAADLGRADLPWVRSWDYSEKYASNPLVERLRDRPFEHRVANLPREFMSPEFQRTFHEPEKMAYNESMIFKLFDFEWVQHLFGYYNIQSLNLVQLSRKPADLKAFEEAFALHGSADYARLLPRYWQLTNTRYLVGEQGFLRFLDSNLDPQKRRFSILERFNLKPKGGRTTPRDWADLDVLFATNGDFALYEFSGALPRLRFYSDWQISTNAEETLKLLTDPRFEPEHKVLVGQTLPAGAVPSGRDEPAGTVQFSTYSPRHVTLKAEVTAPGVLLMNDRIDPAWNLRVDGQPQPLLRCNYLMRGVFLTPGAHAIELRFQPPFHMLYFSLAGVCAGLVLLGFVVWPGSDPREGAPPSAKSGRGQVQPRRKEAARAAER